MYTNTVQSLNNIDWTHQPAGTTFLRRKHYVAHLKYYCTKQNTMNFMHWEENWQLLEQVITGIEFLVMSKLSSILLIFVKKWILIARGKIHIALNINFKTILFLFFKKQWNSVSNEDKRSHIVLNNNERVPPVPALCKHFYQQGFLHRSYFNTCLNC